MRATPKGEKSCLWQVFSDDRRRLQSISLSIEIALQTARTNSLWCTNKKGEVFLVFFVAYNNKIKRSENESDAERRKKLPVDCVVFLLCIERGLFAIKIRRKQLLYVKLFLRCRFLSLLIPCFCGIRLILTALCGKI